VQIGIRTHNPDTMGFHIADAPSVHAHGTAAVVERVRRITDGHPVYLSFDIDCLDPAFAPGTGTPVSGGLSSAQAIAILTGLGGIALAGADVVEVAPAYDTGQVTALAAAHIGFLLLALYAQRPAGKPGR
jgi:agmatinase